MAHPRVQALVTMRLSCADDEVTMQMLIGKDGSRRDVAKPC